jgi:hypothetical protein
MLFHIDHDPCCSDPTCPCHEDDPLISEGSQHVEQGLLSPAEATRLVQGRQF